MLWLTKDPLLSAAVADPKSGWNWDRYPGSQPHMSYFYFQFHVKYTGRLRNVPDVTQQLVADLLCLIVTKSVFFCL